MDEERLQGGHVTGAVRVGRFDARPGRGLLASMHCYSI